MLTNHIRLSVALFSVALLGVLGVVTHVSAQSSFRPPVESISILSPIRFDSALSVYGDLHSRFATCDKFDVCDGKPVTHKCSTDPNHNSVVLKLADGVIFYDGKMAIDADGSDLAKTRPGITDQSVTSLKYPVTGASLDADKVPYVVIPNSGFASILGIEPGDIAAVVYKNKLAYAVVGDTGPKCKLGEGSIELHQQLGQRGCRKRDNKGTCISAGATGIERNVLYFIFPHSKAELYPGLTLENVNERLVKYGSSLMNALRDKYSSETK